MKKRHIRNQRIQALRFHLLRHLGQNRVRRIAIVGIQKTENIATGQRHTLVHGIVNTFVLFTDEFGDTILIRLYHFKRTIVRQAVHNNIFYPRICLVKY